MRKILSLLFSTMALGATFATEYFVNGATGDDVNAGTSWTLAKKTIQAAIDKAVDNDTITVTNGTYAPISTENKAMTIRSVNGAGNTVIDGGETNLV